MGELYDTVGIPPNIESLQSAGSSGWAAFQVRASCDIPFQPLISLWFTILPVSTCGTKAYDSARKPSTIAT